MIVSLTNKLTPARDTNRYQPGDYVISRYCTDQPRNLMQVLGYDTFGQVVTVCVRQKHWKKVPKHINWERDLLDPREYGIALPEET